MESLHEELLERIFDFLSPLNRMRCLGTSQAIDRLLLTHVHCGSKTTSRALLLMSRRSAGRMLSLRIPMTSLIGPAAIVEAVSHAPKLQLLHIRMGLEPSIVRALRLVPNIRHLRLCLRIGMDVQPPDVVPLLSELSPNQVS